MKKYMKLIVVLIIIAIILGFSYNSLVKVEEAVNLSFSKLNSSYQRRADLVPNLVNTVKGQANFEQETLTSVINARAKATSINIDPTKIDANSMQQFQQAQQNLGSSLSRLLVSVERYPELRANEGFMNLQAQLEGTENRITVARNKFNDVVRTYNQKVRSFPLKLVAMIFGFDSKPYFEADKGSEKAPTVSF